MKEQKEKRIEFENFEGEILEKVFIIHKMENNLIGHTIFLLQNAL